jgi:hypothetical protein
VLKAILLASALSLFMAVNAAAVTISYGGIDYELTTVVGSYDALSPTLQAQPWWGQYSAAKHFSDGTAHQLGVYNSKGYTPYFAFDANPAFSVGIAVSFAEYTTGSRPDYHISSDRAAVFAVAQVSQVPLPAAGWLFMSALIGLMGKKRLSRRSVH